MRERLASAWTAGTVSGSLPEGDLPTLVVLVSGEAPGLLGARLRELSRSPSMSGKLLAVYSLSGPLRPDLPVSLLRDGNLAGIGVAEPPPVGLPEVVNEIGLLSDALKEGKRSGISVDGISSSLVWYF
jgi:hypothetical protein